MYGTRDAAQNWEAAYTEFLKTLNFEDCQGSPCIFHHSQRNVTIVVHGDDFTAAGPKRQLDWFETEMRKKYELTVGGRLGPGPKDDK